MVFKMGIDRAFTTGKSSSNVAHSRLYATIAFYLSMSVGLDNRGAKAIFAEHAWLYWDLMHGKSSYPVV